MKRIHWKKLVSRKVLFMAGTLTFLATVEHFVQFHFVSRGVELSAAALIDHLLFGIPFEDV